MLVRQCLAPVQSLSPELGMSVEYVDVNICTQTHILYYVVYIVYVEDYDFLEVCKTALWADLQAAFRQQQQQVPELELDRAEGEGGL